MPSLVGGQQGLQTTGGAGALMVPGLGSVQGLEQGGNRIGLSTTLVSQDQEKVNFVVNKLSLAGDGASQAIVYTFSPGLPGTMYPQSGQVVIDVSNLASSTQSKATVDIDSVGSSLASQNSVVVNAMTRPIAVDASKSSFDVMEIEAVTQDGKKHPLNLCSPTTAVFDPSIMKVYITCGDMIGATEGLISEAGIVPVGVEGLGPGGGIFVPVGEVTSGGLLIGKPLGGPCDYTCPPETPTLDTSTSPPMCKGNADKDKCMDGTTLDPGGSGKCITDQTCAAGNVGASGNCESDAKCPGTSTLLPSGWCNEPLAGGQCNNNMVPFGGSCWVYSTCDGGGNYVGPPGSQKCEVPPTCMDGTTLNTATGKCEVDPGWQCKSGELKDVPGGTYFECWNNALCPEGCVEANGNCWYDPPKIPEQKDHSLPPGSPRVVQMPPAPQPITPVTGEVVVQPPTGVIVVPQETGSFVVQPPVDVAIPPERQGVTGDVRGTGRCPAGTYPDGSGGCYKRAGPSCGQGTHPDSSGKCVKDPSSVDTKPCGHGGYKDATGKCVDRGTPTKPDKKDNTDKQSVKGQTTPKQTTPKQTTSKQTTPKQTTLKQTTPKQTTPKQTTPKQTVMQKPSSYQKPLTQTAAYRPPIRTSMPRTPRYTPAASHQTTMTRHH